MPLTKNELDGFQYLCGYVVKNFIKKLKNHENYKTEQYQIMIAIVECICTDDYDQKLINCLSRGGLTASICQMAEELFLKYTMGNPHKIDTADNAGSVDQKT